MSKKKVKKYLPVSGIFAGLKIPESARGKWIALVDGKIVLRTKNQDYFTKRFRELQEKYPDKWLEILYIPTKEEEKVPTIYYDN